MLRLGSLNWCVLFVSFPNILNTSTVLMGFKSFYTKMQIMGREKKMSKKDAHSIDTSKICVLQKLCRKASCESFDHQPVWAHNKLQSNKMEMMNIMFWQHLRTQMENTRSSVTEHIHTVSHMLWTALFFVNWLHTVHLELIMILSQAKQTIQHLNNRTIKLPITMPTTNQ